MGRLRLIFCVWFHAGPRVGWPNAARFQMPEVALGRVRSDLGCQETSIEARQWAESHRAAQQPANTVVVNL